MRGKDEQTGSLFSYQGPESMVPTDHPLRVIRTVVNAALERLSVEFSQLYSPYGRASIAPEKRNYPRPCHARRSLIPLANEPIRS